MKTLAPKIVAVFLALATTAAAAPPRPFTGTVIAVPDADTLTVQRRTGEPVKVRVHWSDAPEVAHNTKEVDQPGGPEARAFAEKLLVGETVTAQPVGRSYERIVADVTLADGGSYGFALVAAGHAWLDPRYKPPKDWTAAMKQAQTDGRGLWADPGDIPPWEWRKLTREEQRKRK